MDATLGYSHCTEPPQSHWLLHIWIGTGLKRIQRLLLIVSWSPVFDRSPNSRNGPILRPELCKVGLGLIRPLRLPWICLHDRKSLSPRPRTMATYRMQRDPLSSRLFQSSAVGNTMPRPWLPCLVRISTCLMKEVKTWPTINGDVVVGRCTLPRAKSRQFRVAQGVLGFDGIGREVDISFDLFVGVCFRDDLPIECRCSMWHNGSALWTKARNSCAIGPRSGKRGSYFR